MLGIILIIAIGNYFYRLAKEYNKNLWLFAILGVVSYYAGTFLGGLIIGSFIALNGGEVDDSSAFQYGLMAIPVGLLCCYIFYRILNNVWSKENRNRADTLDSEELWK